MQICTIQKPKEEKESPVQFFEIYADLAEKYGNLCVVEIDHLQFIIKALGRKDYREIMLNADLDTYLKEEAICELCCLYPEAFDFDECDAGIPTKLFNEIITFSFLANEQEKERINLMNYYRQEMVELHNQINCMIAEAFPSLDFDKIENFDMFTALKYLSRAEWILQNLRNFEMYYDPFTGKEWDAEDITPNHYPASQKMSEPEPAPIKETPQENNPGQPKVVPPGLENTKSFIPGESIAERIERLKRGDLKKEKLTPEKLSQLERQFPEIDWRQQATEQDFQLRIDTTPAGLRTP